MASIDDPSTDNESYEGYIVTNVFGDIRDGSQIHQKLDARDARLKIRDCIK